MKAVFTLIIIIFFTSFCDVHAQDAGINKWIYLLKDNSDEQALQRDKAYKEIKQLDTASIIRTANEIEKITAGGSKRTKFIGKATRAKLLFYYLLPQDSAYTTQMKEAWLTVSQMDEPYLEAEYGRTYAEMLYSLNKTAMAVQYAISSLKIHEYIGSKYFPKVSSFYMVVGEMLYATRNDRDAVAYLLKGLRLSATDTVPYYEKMFTYNNLGLAYKTLKQFDSSLYYYQKCMQFALANNRPDWWYTASLNRYEPYMGMQQYDSAGAIASRLLQFGLAQKDEESVMHGNWTLGQVYLRQGKFAQSLPLLLKGNSMIEERGIFPLIRVNQFLAECYEGLGQTGKAYYYLKIFKQKNDSAEKERAKYTSNYLHAKAMYDEEQFKIKTLESKRKKQVYIRNVSIISIVLLAAIALWWLNIRRRKAKALQQNAEATLMDFKEDLIAKNERIEVLLAEINNQNDRQHHAEKIEELSRQMILTEDDWLHFKTLFQKSYPGFFELLRQKTTGITEAEMRMAALIKIRLSTKQMAAMQGISAESIHKNRQRLRQRLSLSSSDELENLLDTI